MGVVGSVRGERPSKAVVLEEQLTKGAAVLTDTCLGCMSQSGQGEASSGPEFEELVVV